MIDLCCIFVISVAIIILLLLIYGNDYKQKILQNKKVCCVILFILAFPLFLFINVIAKTEYAIDDSDYQVFSKYESGNQEIKKLGLNKVIIVGDSRMEFIEDDKDELDIPNNFIFDAKSGAKIDWTKDIAIPKLKELLEENSNYNCHVIFNMGVNDVNDDIDIKSRVNDYFNLYTEIIDEYENVEFYLLSVNPVDDDKIDDYWWDNTRTNEKIEKFNSYTIKLLNKSTFNNATYCDSYHNLEFNIPDGLHYDNETNQKIIDYIKNDCVVYK